MSEETGLIYRAPPDLLALKKQANTEVMEVQGFAAAAMAGAAFEFEAPARVSADARAVAARMNSLAGAGPLTGTGAKCCVATTRSLIR